MLLAWSSTERVKAELHHIKVDLSAFSLLRVDLLKPFACIKKNRTKILPSGSFGLKEYTWLHGCLLYFHNNPALKLLEVTRRRIKIVVYSFIQRIFIYCLLCHQQCTKYLGFRGNLDQPCFC